MPDQKNKILFYEGPWYAFSNFASFMVYWRKQYWMTSEHAYQAAKFTDPLIVEEIRLARSAHEAKKAAQAHIRDKVPNWQEIKLSVMEDILRAKLEQHPYIQSKLLETGSLEIVENSPKNSFWGRGFDWRGQNHLGKIWMKLREELRAGK